MSVDWEGRGDQLAIGDRNDERACEEDEDEREQEQAQAVVFAGELRIHWLAEHDWVEGEGDEEERKIGQRVREEPPRACGRGIAEELDGQEQEEAS